MKRTYAFLVLLISTGFCLMNPVLAQNIAPTSTVASRVVEDGGTGPFKAIMVSESSFPT